MSIRNGNTMSYPARALLGAGLAATTACTEVEVDELDTFKDDEIEFRNHLPDALLPSSSNQLGSNPAYEGGVVTTSEPLAAQVGRQILLEGGNAIDAAVAVQFMLAVIEPQSSGLGGGGFMLYHKANTPPEDTIVIDFRDRAPAAVKIDMLNTSHSSSVKGSSGYAAGVPGTAKAMLYALEKYGSKKITRKRAMADAIYYAKNGFTVTSRLATDTGSSRLRLETSANKYNLGAYAEARKVFRPNGSNLKAGTRLKQPNLATTLERIRDQGDWAIYSCSSPINKAIVDTQKATRTGNPGGYGRMTCKDLENYKLRVHDPADPSNSPPEHAPLVGAYHGYKVVAMPPPSSGVFLLQMLDMLEALEKQRSISFGKSPYTFGQAPTLNVLQELMRVAFADRSWHLGDPDFYKVPVAGLLDPTYVQARAGLIKPGVRYKYSFSPGNPPATSRQATQDARRIQDKLGTPGKPELPEKEGTDTTHFTIVDGEGNAVSVTSTVSDLWGTGLMAKGCGFMLNSQLLNFNDAPQGTVSLPGANDVQGGKSPRTTMAPAMLFKDDKLVAAYGSPGGTGILNALFQVTLNMIDHRMTVWAAVDAPRVSLDTGSSAGVTELESGFSASVVSSLENLGYDFDAVADIGDVQAIVRYPGNGRQYGAADWRRVGGVAGIDEN